MVDTIFISLGCLKELGMTELRMPWLNGIRRSNNKSRLRPYAHRRWQWD